MEFQIGPWIYRVHITPEPIYDDDGNEQAGRCCWSSHVIEISGSIPLRQRLETLLHELRHAWVFTVGRTHGDEDDANNAAAFTATCMREMLRQGGEPALRRMVPPGCEPLDVRQQLWDDSGEASGAECGKCASKFAAGAVINSPPQFDARYKRLVILRSIWCDYCSHVQQWSEGCTQTGLPNGQILGEPAYIRGTEATDFMRRNGDKLGVVVS